MAKPRRTLCHISDIHLGYRRFSKLTAAGINQREHDVYSAFREVVTKVIAIKPDITIIAGDLFHSVRPSNSIILKAFKEIRRLSFSTGKPIIIIAGNHETPRRVDTGSVLQLFTEIEGVYVIDTAIKRINFQDLSIGIVGIPHAALSGKFEFKERADDSLNYNVLVAHAQVDGGIETDYGGVALRFDQLNPHEWDYIALGHIHSASSIALNAAYSGSTEYTSHNFWHDTGKKGFFEVNLLTGDRKFHELSSPREIHVLEPLLANDISSEDLNLKIGERLAGVPGGIDGKIIRLEVFGVSREAYRQLDHKLIREWRSKALHLSLEIRTTSSGTQISRKAGESLPLMQELRKFSDSWVGDIEGQELSTIMTKLWDEMSRTDEAKLLSENQL